MIYGVEKPTEQTMFFWSLDATILGNIKLFCIMICTFEKIMHLSLTKTNQIEQNQEQ